MKILVSSCLLGKKCRYSGDGCLNERVKKFIEGNEVFDICPEQAGGLPTPRTPAERVGDKVMTADGVNVTEQFYNGARVALETALRHGAELCIMKARSPSCGSGVIYDGTFSSTLTEGDGVACGLLKKHGFNVITEEEV